MGTIVATYPIIPERVHGDWEFPVLSIGSSVNSKHVMESITYYIKLENTPSPERREESSPNDKDCKQFQIGRCWFIEKEGDWFYAETDQQPSERRFPVVYGEKTLEAYRSGEMFEHLRQLFGGPD